MSKKDLRTALDQKLEKSGTDLLLGNPRPLAQVEAALSPETRELLAQSRAKEAEKRRPGRPKKENFEPTDFFRTTIIAHKENYEKLKVVAMKLGRPFKDVLNDALAAAVETFEEKNGKIVLRDFEHENPFKK